MENEEVSVVMTRAELAAQRQQEREERLAEFERKKNERVAKAAERGAMVVIPEGGEAQLFYFMGKAVDGIFRTSRRQELKLSVVPINEMEARLEYKRALVEFSGKLKQIAKKLDRRYEEHAIISGFKKTIDSEQALLEQIKSGFKVEEQK